MKFSLGSPVESDHIEYRDHWKLILTRILEQIGSENITWTEMTRGHVRLSVEVLPLSKLRVLRPDNFRDKSSGRALHVSA